MHLKYVIYIAFHSFYCHFGKIGSFEKDYDFDALVIDDSELNFNNYTLLQRLERFIYIGDDRHIYHRYVNGSLIYESSRVYLVTAFLNWAFEGMSRPLVGSSMKRYLVLQARAKEI